MADFEVTLQDGRPWVVADVPEDTPESELIRIAEEQATQPFEMSKPPAGFTNEGIPAPGTLEGVARSGAQGNLFGFQDELTGNLAAGIMAATGQIPENSSFGDVRDRAIDIERRKLSAFREANPVAATVSEIGGAIPTAIAAAPARLSGSLGVQMLKSGGVGAGQGTVFGIGSGEGEGRLSSALAPGAVGGVIGTIVPGIGPVARPIINRFTGSGQAARQAGMSTRAFDQLSDIAQADAGRGAQNIAAGGPTAMLADAGPALSGTADMLARRPGASAGIVQDAIEGRVSDVAGRVTGTMDDVLGQPQGLRASARDIAARTAPARAEAYEIAYSQAVDYASDAGQQVRNVLARVPDRIREQAVRQANEMAQLEGVPMPAITGTDDALSVMQLDFLKRSLNEVAEENVNNFGQKTGLGRLVEDVAKDLRDATVIAVPGYREALQLGGDNIITRNALELGSDLLKAGTKREAVNEFIERASVNGELPADVLDAFRVGIRSQIDETLANVRAVMSDPNLEAREARKLLTDLSSRASRDKVTAVLGADEAGRLFDQVDEAMKAFNLRAATSMRSPTAPRGSIEDRLTQPSLLDEALQFRPSALRETAATALTGGQGAQNLRVDARLAEMASALTGPRGQEAQQLLRLLQQGQTDAARAQAITNRIQQLILAGSGIQAPATIGARR